MWILAYQPTWVFPFSPSSFIYICIYVIIRAGLACFTPYFILLLCLLFFLLDYTIPDSGIPMEDLTCSVKNMDRSDARDGIP
ncbi:hypothetical protein V8F33_007606 [Rhypophila sp. PSN 637]